MSENLKSKLRYDIVTSHRNVCLHHDVVTSQRDVCLRHDSVTSHGDGVCVMMS